MAQQWYCCIAGQQSGPVGIDTLREWFSEGRLGGEDLVWCEGMAQWQQAMTLPQLQASPAADVPAVPPPIPSTAGSVSASSPLDALTMAVASESPSRINSLRSRRLPHRGTMILVFGILSWVFCFIFGIMAWSMGSKDLAEMAAGRMDRSGESITRAGKVLGMIHVLLGIPATIIFLMLI